MATVSTTLPILRKGSTGDSVFIVQLILNNFHGLDIKTDAIFGIQTENAIKDLQNAHSLSATGSVDKLTWEALATAD